MRCLPLLPPGCSLFNAWLDAEIEIGSAVIGCAVIGPWVGSSCVGVLLFNSLCSRACSLFNSSSSAWRFRVRSLNSVRASSSSAARCAIATCRLCASPTCTRRCASNVCSAREDASSSKFRATLKLTLAKNCACCNNASAVFSPPEGFPVRKWQIAAMRGRMDSRAELLDSLAELPVELEQLFGVGAFAGRSRTPARARTSKDGSGGATVLLPLTEGERARLAPPPTAVVRDSVANFRQSSALPTSAWYPPLSKRWPGGSPSPSRTSTSVAPASTEFKSSPPPSLLPTSNIPPPPPPPPLGGPYASCGRSSRLYPPDRPEPPPIGVSSVGLTVAANGAAAVGGPRAAAPDCAGGRCGAPDATRRDGAARGGGGCCCCCCP
mmetsp:Transcript_14245/g.33206  ORF Transcript_14245/g.33206 Transcript_14245/m.33206 type:complete len:380 (-) Transcript_14245:12-1151(-)